MSQEVVDCMWWFGNPSTSRKPARSTRGGPTDWLRNPFEVACGLRDTFHGHPKEKYDYLLDNDKDFDVQQVFL